MRRKKDKLLPMVGIMQIDSAKSQGVVGQRDKCLVQRLGRGICPGSVLDCGYGIILNVKFLFVNVRWHGDSGGKVPPRKSRFDTSIVQNIFSLMDCSSYNPRV